MKQSQRFLSAKEAAELLNISRATLYAYVSRGLVRSEATGGKRRTKRYYAEDVERLKERQEQRRNPAEAVSTAAATALHFGQPVLESAVTLITDGRCYYRGYDAVTLARQYPLEQIAVLLWDETESQPESWQSTAETLFSAPPIPLHPRFQTVHAQVADLTPMEQFQILLPLAAANDFTAYDFRPDAFRQTGARILKLMVNIAAGTESSGRTLAATLQQGWLPDEPQAATWLNKTLVLCADHELNLSAFTARCVASGDATLYAVVSAGLAALTGARHGGFSGRVSALFQEVGTPELAQAALKARLKRGDQIPGFGHPLYPEGDPRGRALLALAKEARPNSTAVHLAQAINESAQSLIGQLPTLDFGLVTLSLALELPPGSSLA
ncbi:MAG: citrate synthase family protein, partial [Candidatus Promineifilaceae bacterium]